MLVLTRKVGESIVISEDIYCTVIGYREGEVRLAFDAPYSIVIHREEIQHRINHDRNKNQWYSAPISNQESIVDRLISKFKQQEISTKAHQ